MHRKSAASPASPHGAAGRAAAAPRARCPSPRRRPDRRPAAIATGRHACAADAAGRVAIGVGPLSSFSRDNAPPLVFTCFMARNKATALSFARNLPSRETVATANALLALCDDHVPPFAVVFGSDPEGGFPGSSMQRDRALIFLATEGQDGRRRAPEDILISLAHEVGHVFDPPTPADQKIQEGTPAYFSRLLQREETAWSWASSFLQQARSWPQLEVAFERAQSFAIAHYRALVRT
jgi:hypothetical protein